MSESLRRDMYDLHHPGISIDDVRKPELDPLALARYPCIYWVDHLRDAMSHRTSMPINDLQDDSTVHQFLSKKYLYWLEALSLLRHIPEGVAAMTKLETLLEESDKSRLFDVVRDVRRFILSHGWAIGKAPLQAYASALIFSPRGSITRKLFRGEEPTWIIPKPTMAEDWNACLATLEGHGAIVNSIAFSPDGQRLASASRDKTIKVWDSTTGYCQATLEGHRDWVTQVVFSPDGQRLASASDDRTIKMWDATTGRCEATLEGHEGEVFSVAFSPDGQRLASASLETVKIWDTKAGHCQATLEGHVYAVYSVAFSPDGQRLASASGDKTIKMWDATTSHCQVMLEGHGDRVTQVVFSPDGQRLASASFNQAGFVKVWDATTGRFNEVSTRLVTDAGHRFDPSLFSPSPSTPAEWPASGPLHQLPQCQGYDISTDGIWIMYRGRNLLWLPSEYRPMKSATRASSVALGCRSGRILLFRFYPDTASSMASLSATYHDQGRYNEAESVKVEALDLRRKVLGEKHPDTIRSMEYLAAMYHSQGRYNKAEPIYVQALELRREVLGEKHSDTIRSMADLATMYYQQGRYNEAGPMDFQVLKLRGQVLGEKHPDTIMSMVELAATYYTKGRYNEAELICIKALELRREVLGEKHPDTVRSMADLAATCHMQGRYSEAELMQIQVLELRREVLGEKHPDTIRSMADLAATCYT